MTQNFTLRKRSKLDRDKLYAISIDIKNFPHYMPKYFKSIKIRKDAGKEVWVDEIISFLGSSLRVKTRHLIVHPRIHEVHILSGPMSGSSFEEAYDEILGGGTNVTIKVTVQFNGVFRILTPLGFLLKRQMSMVMDEFLDMAERVSGQRDKF